MPPVGGELAAYVEYGALLERELLVAAALVVVESDRFGHKRFCKHQKTHQNIIVVVVVVISENRDENKCL